MKNSFGSLIWSSFIRIHGGIIGIISIVLTVLLWLFSPDTKIPLGWVIPFVLMLAILIITLFDAVNESLNKNSRSLPRVLRVIDEKCFFEPSELFSHDAIVSFYYNDEGFERLLGVGTVVAIQEDGKIQVIMDRSFDGYGEIIEKLKQNDVSTLNKVIIKPNVPKTYLNLTAS